MLAVDEHADYAAGVHDIGHRFIDFDRLFERGQDEVVDVADDAAAHLVAEDQPSGMIRAAG